MKKSVLLYFWALCGLLPSMVGCGGCYFDIEVAQKDSQQGPTQSPYQAPPNEKIVVLFHDWGNADTAPLEKFLKAKLGNEVKILALIEADTFGKAIDAQAQAAYTELRKENGIEAANIGFVGVGQGALRAYATLRTFGDELKGKKCLVSIAGLWEGVHMLTDSSAQGFRDELIKLADAGSDLLGLDTTLKMLRDNSGAGLDDMKSLSNFLQQATKALQQTSIPTLLIAGSQHKATMGNKRTFGALAECLFADKWEDEYFSSSGGVKIVPVPGGQYTIGNATYHDTHCRLIEAFVRLTAASDYPKGHNGITSVRSQLAEHTTVAAAVERYVVYMTTHLSVPSAPETLTKTAEFLRQHLGL